MFTLIIRVTCVKIHGIKYCSHAVVRVKKPMPIIDDHEEPFLYCSINNIYVYKDVKIFELEKMKILLYDEKLRAIQVKSLIRRYGAYIQICFFMVYYT